MRIAIDGRGLTEKQPTGVGIYTFELITALAQTLPKADIMVFVSGTPSALHNVPRFPQKNIELIEILLPNKLLSTLLLLPLPITLDHFLPRTPDAWIFPNHNIIKTRRPYFFTVHDLSFVLAPEFFTVKDHFIRSLSRIRSLAERAAHLFAVSESTAKDLSLHWQIPPDRITVTPLGVHHHMFLTREQPSDRTFRAMYDLNRPYFLTLATREPRKNFSSVIEAYNDYRSRGGKPYPLVMVGGNGWKKSDFFQALTHSPFRADIRLLGYVPEKHKAALYRGASVFLFPSFYEGFGLPVLEAMACGVPVIASHTSAIPEITKHAAVLIDPFNVQDISLALSALMDAPDSETLRTFFKKQGPLRAKAFAWEKTVARTISALQNVIQ